MYGRVVYSKDTFERLDEDKDRKVVYITDQEGIDKIYKTFGLRDKLKIIGFEDNYIDKLFDEKMIFKLVTMDNIDVFPATWEGLLKITKKIYDIDTEQYLNDIKKMTFQNLQESTGLKWEDHELKSDPRYLSYDTRQECPEGDTWKKCKKNVGEFRRLLFHAFDVRELYRGDGVTVPGGVNEYLTHNYEIDTEWEQIILK